MFLTWLAVGTWIYIEAQGRHEGDAPIDATDPLPDDLVEKPYRPVLRVLWFVEQVFCNIGQAVQRTIESPQILRVMAHDLVESPLEIGSKSTHEAPEERKDVV